MGANSIWKLLLLLLSLAAAATASDFPDRENAEEKQDEFFTRVSSFKRSAGRRYAAGCELGLSYWHAAGQRCVTCSRCNSEQIVVRPCGLDRDIVCGPLSDLNLEYWAWLKERHSLIKEAESADNADSLRAQESSSQQSQHWEWDWEAGVLLIAIIMCALFFAVAAGYSLHHVRHWRLLEEHYEADVEEISTRLALISAASASLVNCTQPNGIITLPPTPDINQDGNCANLEQLLAGKSASRHPGRINIYIEDNES